ncbi:glycosyltransferase family A protein [Sphingomonas sp. UYP23]
MQSWEHDMSIASAPPIPVFFISFNRGRMLERAVAAIRLQRMPVQVIVHDNGSSDPETLEVLKKLESSGTIIYRYSPIDTAEQLNMVNDSVARYFSQSREMSDYIVSDCDIDMSVAYPDALDMYQLILRKFENVECVGPMLRIRDISIDYPLRNRALNRHIEQFWRHVPQFSEIDGRKYAYQEATIDTTLAMHRSGEPFRRLKKGIRLYEPFEALHLDWYVPSHDDIEMNEFYANTSKYSISHWNNISELSIHKDDTLIFDTFNYIEIGGDGGMEVRQNQIGSD